MIAFFVGRSIGRLFVAPPAASTATPARTSNLLQVTKLRQQSTRMSMSTGNEKWPSPAHAGVADPGRDRGKRFSLVIQELHNIVIIVSRQKPGASGTSPRGRIILPRARPSTGYNAYGLSTSSNLRVDVVLRDDTPLAL